MPSRSPSRWLETFEEQAIIDFIRCNPGRKGREIAEYLDLPRRSVNGFLYRHGAQNGVENLDYRWYPIGLVQEPERLSITPPRQRQPEPERLSITTPRQRQPEPESLSITPPRQRPPEPAPKPEWTDEKNRIKNNVVNTDSVNLAPVNKQSGWSRVGCLYAGLFVVAALLLIKAARGAELVQVRSCYDGDTCTTTTGERVRLACIDTPELRGKRAKPIPAKEARDHLRSLVVGKKVGIRRITKDRYGRTVAELFLGTTNVQQEMVATGHAQIFWRYAYQCPWTKRQ